MNDIESFADGGEESKSIQEMNSRFGARLSELRKKASLSQVELAERLDVHAANVSHWEMGRRMPSIEVAMRLAGVFDVSLDFLMGRVAAEPSSAGHISPLTQATSEGVAA